MARHGIVALLAATILGLGVNAGPCKPYSSATLSSSVTLETTTTATTHETASSTITADATETTDALQTTVTDATTDATDTTDVLETTITESASDTTSAFETTVTDATTATGTTDVSETTITESATGASSTLEPTTITTTAAVPPPCVESQILVNPSFDDNSDASPWDLGAGVTVSQVNPRSDPNFLYNTLVPTRTSATFSQQLPALGSSFYQLEYYFNLQTAINGRGFSCTATPMVNQQVLAPSIPLTDAGPYGFQQSVQGFTPLDQDSPAVLSITIECEGSFNTIIIGVDDVALARLCGAQ